MRSSTLERSTSPAPRAVRVRLAPETRREAILDAALVQFSTLGYEASRIDDIAAGAELSKGGFYAHFSSKDEVFEALLARSLVLPALDASALVEQSATARELCEQLVNALYASLSQPRLMAMSKIVLMDGHRLPHVVDQWRKSMLTPLYQQISGMLRAAVAKGICRDSIVCAEPWLVISPAAHLVMQRLALGAGTDRRFNRMRPSIAPRKRHQAG